RRPGCGRRRSRRAAVRRPRRSRADPRRTGAPALVLRRGVRVDDGAGLELLGVEHHLLARPAELIDARAVDLLVLDHEGASLCPLAVLPELHLADDRVDLGGAEVIAQQLLVYANRRLEGLAEHPDQCVLVVAVVL